MPSQSQRTSTQTTTATSSTTTATASSSGSSNAEKASALTSKLSFPTGTSLKWGDKGELVERLQQLLSSKGYTVPVTGNFLNMTAAAVTAFQKANALKPDGVAGPVTLGKLTGSSSTAATGSSAGSTTTITDSTTLTGVPSLKIGSSGAQVKLLQERLKHYGASINPDGDFGAVTDREVRKFQAANGLKEDGVVGPVTAGKLASSTAKSITAGSSTSTGSSGSSTSSGSASKSYLARAKIAVDAAMGQQGVPYVYGAYSPGKAFDCSGLTYWAWKQAGVSLRLNSQYQLDDCKKITAAELVPGDLVFFKTGANQAVPTAKVNHVGMYIGNGKMIHAPRTGDVVKVATCNTGNAVGFGRPG